MQKTRAGRWVALALAGAITLTGCSGTADDARDAGTAEVTASGQSLDAAQFADLAAGEGVVVLDVRTPEEFAAGHLEGAVNLDVSAADVATRVADLDPDATYAVYCRSGNRSQAAMALMQGAGIGSLADLVGGIEAWSQAGLPVVTGS